MKKKKLQHLRSLYIIKQSTLFGFSNPNANLWYWNSSGRRACIQVNWEMETFFIKQIITWQQFIIRHANLDGMLTSKKKKKSCLFKQALSYYKYSNFRLGRLSLNLFKFTWCSTSRTREWERGSCPLKANWRNI